MAQENGIKRARSIYGGLHFSTAFFGWLVATGVSILLGALVSAIGGVVAFSTDTNAQDVASSAETVGIVSAIVLLIVLAVAYYAGGYVAGRMARFDTARQGVGVWIVGVIITALLAAAGGILGTGYNLLQEANIPSMSLNGQDLTSGGLITLVLALVVSLLAAIRGGAMGGKFHASVDQTVDRAEEEHSAREQVMQRRNIPSFGERIESSRANRTRRR